MKKYYDAVIVGCGVAGCFAALHLPQEADILMITKADTEAVSYTHLTLPTILRV